MKPSVLNFFTEQRDTLIEDLRTLLRQPSVATEDHGMIECADLLMAQMRAFGMAPDLWPTDGYPAIYCHVQGASDQTILIYGHYDVQPVQRELWHVDPWGAVIEEGRIYGRGAVDDKGAVMAALQGVRAYLQAGITPPVSVIFLIEGEEEIGSPNLAPVLRQHRDALAADALINFDDNVWPDGRPRVVTGVKGGTRIRIEARRPREFHGMMAPLVQNALWRLTYALASMRDPDGTIRVDDFYDDVRAPTPVELEALRTLPWDGVDILRLSGQSTFVGDVTGLEALTQLYMTPTCNITGLEGGYVRPMRKSVVPAFGAVEIDFRTVPNQSPQRIVDLVRAHLDRRGFDDLHVELLAAMDWFRCAPDSPAAQALGEALTAAFGVEPARQPTYPGSGPEPLFAEILGIEEQAYSGFGPTEDRLHAPNEYIRIDDYLHGAEAVAHLLEHYAAIKAAVD